MLSIKNEKYEKRNDPVVENNVYDAKIINFKPFSIMDREGNSVDKIMVLAEITEPGFEGIQVPGFVYANFRPSLRSTVNLRRWCEALGAQFPENDQEEWSFDLDTLVGRPCKIKTEQYMGFDRRNNVQMSKCKITDIMSAVKKAPVQAVPTAVPNTQTTVNQAAQAQEIAMSRAYAQTVAPSYPQAVAPTVAAAPAPAPQPVIPQPVPQPVVTQVAPAPEPYVSSPTVEPTPSTGTVINNKGSEESPW